MNNTILITGASGAIAQAVANTMIENGLRVHMLSRAEFSGRLQKRNGKQIPVVDDSDDVSSLNSPKFFRWDPVNLEIDIKCFEGVFAILHLAGESIFGKPWTKARRKRILNSRVDTIDFLVKSIPSWQLPYIKVLISASATGYYPANISDSLTEESPAGQDFLAQVCRQWENKIQDLAAWGGFREVRFRNGIVLDRRSGVYQKLHKQTKWGLACIPGNGLQKMPWIHLDDVCVAIKSALLDSSWSGPYNLVAPDLVSMLDICEGIAASLNRKILIPPLPSWFLKGVMGEMSSLLLDSYTVLPDRLLKRNFDFRYPTLGLALADLRNS